MVSTWSSGVKLKGFILIELTLPVGKNSNIVSVCELILLTGKANRDTRTSDGAHRERYFKSVASHT